MLSTLAELEKPRKRRYGRTSNYGEQITCRGVSRKGKHLIDRYGKVWAHIRDSENVIFSDKEGPWWLVHPINVPSAARWVNKKDDQDIKVMSAGSVLTDWKLNRIRVPETTPMLRGSVTWKP